MLAQNPLQRPAVHFETPRRLGNVAIAQLEDPLNVLPAHPVGRHRILRRLRRDALLGEERAFDRIGIDTGAFASGILTCLILQGEEWSFLQT